MSLESSPGWVARLLSRSRAVSAMPSSNEFGGSSADSAAHARPADTRPWVTDAQFVDRLVRIGYVLVVIAYLLIGVLGHDPWKQDETYTFGIIAHMLHTGDWVVPTNAGQPFMEKPPLYDWVAAGLASLFGRWLAVFDAARLASACFTAVTLLFLARSARLFHDTARRNDARVLGTLALFASTFVVLKHVHDLMTDVALLTGATMALYGLMALVRALEHTRVADALATSEPIPSAGQSLDHAPTLAHAFTQPSTRPDDRQPTESLARATRPWVSEAGRAALWLGLGTGIAMMSKGVFVPLVVGLAACALPFVVPACRDRRYAHALLIALGVFMPFATIWPAALYGRSPELFKLWFWDNNIGRFFGFSVAQLGAENDKHFFVVRTLLSSAIPVGPLAVLGVISGGWRRLRHGVIAAPLLFAMVGLTVLGVSATARQVYVLPFVPVLALFASDAIRCLPRRFHIGWDYVCRVIFAAAVTAIWAAWAVMTGSMENHWWLEGLARWLPLDYALQTPITVFVLAVAITVAWGTSMGLASRAGMWRGVLTWSASVAAVWGLVFTLLLPWVDYSKSYRSPFEDLAGAIAPYWTSRDCMASYSLGESEAPMLELFTGIEHRPIGLGEATSCRWLIVQSERVQERPSGDWVPFWGGTRPGDDEQVIRVYRRATRADQRIGSARATDSQ
ncbi:Glycosyl transferase [Pararobbsia alpina]|uniref:ArnT family glycosyltransferase n=1 Tax=Pararobbsia alpina TaxID=621374 RepID=UPI0039A6A2C4